MAGRSPLGLFDGEPVEEDAAAREWVRNVRAQWRQRKLYQQRDREPVQVAAVAPTSVEEWRASHRLICLAFNDIFCELGLAAKVPDGEPITEWSLDRAIHYGRDAA
jgi:hypothetical protein